MYICICIYISKETAEMLLNNIVSTISKMFECWLVANILCIFRTKECIYVYVYIYLRKQQKCF